MKTMLGQPASCPIPIPKLTLKSAVNHKKNSFCLTICRSVTQILGFTATSSLHDLFLWRNSGTCAKRDEFFS